MAEPNFVTFALQGDVAFAALHEQRSGGEFSSLDQSPHFGAVPFVFDHLDAIQPVLDVTVAAHQAHVVEFARGFQNVFPARSDEIVEPPADVFG